MIHLKNAPLDAPFYTPPPTLTAHVPELSPNTVEYSFAPEPHPTLSHVNGEGYASHVEVLTDEGWKSWGQVSGREKFLTRDLLTDTVAWQHTTNQRAMVHSTRNSMVRLVSAHLDIMVTPGQQMITSHPPTTHTGNEPYLHATRTKATDLNPSHDAIPLTGGTWEGFLPTLSADEARVVGCLTAVGEVDVTGLHPFPQRQLSTFVPTHGNVVVCHTTTPNTVTYLKEMCHRVGIMIRPHPTIPHTYMVLLPSSWELSAYCFETLPRVTTTHPNTRTSTPEGTGTVESFVSAESFPLTLLEQRPAVLQGLMEGYLAMKGTLTPEGLWETVNVPVTLANQIMHIGAKTGTVTHFSETPTHHPHTPPAGENPPLVPHLTVAFPYYATPSRTNRAEWHKEDNGATLSPFHTAHYTTTNVAYAGDVYNVTVPHGTLYVRSNGHPLWCGDAQHTTPPSYPEVVPGH